MSETDIVLGQIKRAVDQLSEEVLAGKYPAPILIDFKHSVDQLRLTMWAAMAAEDQRRKEAGGTRMGLDQKFVEFRMKRLEEMLNQFRNDITKGVAHTSHLDLTPLAVALQTTLRNIDRLATGQPN